MEKRKRVFYNIVVGIGAQMISIVLGIIIPRLFLQSFGSEMNGFLNSIGQIFVYVALLEAGVGATTMQALYKSVASEDQQSVSRILSATNIYYQRTGVIYFLAVMILAIVYPIIITAEIPKFTMGIIIIFNGVPGVINFIFQGKYTLLMQAEGKSYILTVLTSIVSTVSSIAKIVLLLLGENIIVIQFSFMVISLLRTLFLIIYINKNYKWVNIHAEPNYNAISQKNAAFVNQICDLIFRNTDTILLSIFCDLKVVSVYALYNLLYSMVKTALDYVAQGFTFVMGQTFNGDIDYFKKIHDAYETYRMALIFALYTIALIFIVPFMKLYTAGITDINYIDYKVAFLFVLSFVLSGARVCEADLISYAQHFKKTQSRCILEAVINLSVSIVGIQLYGIYGVLFGTIAALIYRANDMVLYANHVILNRGTWVTYRKWISNFTLFFVIIFISNKVDIQLDSYLIIIGNAAFWGVLIVLIYFIVASIVNRESFRFVLKILRK